MLVKFSASYDAFGQVTVYVKVLVNINLMWLLAIYRSSKFLGVFNEQYFVCPVQPGAKQCQTVSIQTLVLKSTIRRNRQNPLPGGTPLYRLYRYMCGPKGYGFSAVLVINRVSILADFGHFGPK